MKFIHCFCIKSVFLSILILLMFSLSPSESMDAFKTFKGRFDRMNSGSMRSLYEPETLPDEIATVYFNQNRLNQYLIQTVERNYDSFAQKLKELQIDKVFFIHRTDQIKLTNFEKVFKKKNIQVKLLVYSKSEPRVKQILMDLPKSDNSKVLVIYFDERVLAGIGMRYLVCLVNEFRVSVEELKWINPNRKKEL